VPQTAAEMALSRSLGGGDGIVFQHGGQLMRTLSELRLLQGCPFLFLALSEFAAAHGAAEAAVVDQGVEYAAAAGDAAHHAEREGGAPQRHQVAAQKTTDSAAAAVVESSGQAGQRGQQSRWRQLSGVGGSTVPHQVRRDHLQQLERETQPGVQ